MPYVTDEIYDKLPVKDNETIMLSSYPQYNEKQIYKEFKEMENIIELIKNIRKIKLENNIGKDYYLVHNNKVIIENVNIFEKILKLENKIIEKNIRPMKSDPVQFTIFTDNSFHFFWHLPVNFFSKKIMCICCRHFFIS